jgi:alpha-beta hydrolase superfamily lysophospholipase
MRSLNAVSPRLTAALVRLALASRVGYPAAAYTVSRWLTRPTRGRPQLTPSDFGMSWERLECRTADGLRLAGWLVEPAGARATMALFHGMRFNREQVLGRLQLLATAGYRCIAFDHRAHGESHGKRTSFGFHESRDVAAVLDLIGRRWPHQPRAALGLSMGAAALCYAASAAPGRWHAVILESCYYDLASAFASRLRHDYPPWLQRLTRGVIWVTERRLGVRLAQLTPADHIGRLGPTPVLILTGTADRHACATDAQRLWERCRGPRELWLVPNAGHQDVLEQGGPAYAERVLQFLSLQLKTAA